ncbi:hypothetical protein Tco_0274689 [Tanacetum coccineum]
MKMRNKMKRLNNRIWTTMFWCVIEQREQLLYVQGKRMKEEDTHEPITFQDAINSSEKDEWVRAMEEEMCSLKKNHTWELVDQPPG